MKTMEGTMGTAELAALERGLGDGQYTVRGPAGEIYVMEQAEADGRYRCLEAVYVRAERWNGGDPEEGDRVAASIELADQQGERDIPSYRNDSLDCEECTIRPGDEEYDTEWAMDDLDRLVGLHGAMAGHWAQGRERKPGTARVREYWAFYPDGGGIAARPAITEAA